MGNGRAVSGVDRLPWLADEGEAPKRPNPRTLELVLWAVPLLVLVAIGSYWLGANGARWFGNAPQAVEELPAPAPTAPIAAEPESATAEPSAEPLVPDLVEPEPIAAPAEPRAAARPTRSTETAKARPSAKPSPKSKAEEKPEGPVYWPARVIEGSSGRLVRVGAFASRKQAKRGWFALMRVNPSLQRLPALVVPVASARDGKTYYRLQMGTTSQAHSVALCQKLRMIGQSCVVVEPEPAEKAA